MYLYHTVFIILIVISLFCAYKGIVDRRKNIGLILMAVLVVLDDVICLFVDDLGSTKEATKLLLPHYIIHAWLFFATLLMVIMIGRQKKYAIVAGASAALCVYQTYLVVSQYFGARIFSFQKRIFFRRGWWVAVDSKYKGLLFSFRSYRIAEYINIILILIVLMICIWNTHKIFRGGYISLIVILTMYAVAENITISYSVPIWISTILYNMTTCFIMFFVIYYARTTLKDWSLDSFANEMSDGLILYDIYNDLIHINDMIKNTLDAELVDRFRDRNALEEWIGTESINNEGTLLYKKDGKDYYFRVEVRELGGRSNHIGSLYILHDTTNSMMRILAMEEANRELERANRMKSDFLANMSHEIRTPMNAVIGMTDLAMRDKDTQDITDYLVQIKSSGQNLLNIINDILDYSKIESGKMEIIEEEYQPFIEMSEIANVLFTRIGDKDLELFVMLEDEMPHVLCGDFMRIRQVIINLANNAIKFTPHGIVRIAISCEYISDDTINMTYHVTDTGIGIKEEDIIKLFESFQQLDSKRNRSVEGTGLGLAISKRIVEAMGGTIGVDSVYGEGSDFYFTIPQKVVDSTNDATVTSAEDKFAYVINEDSSMVEMFVKEMQKLKVDAKVIHDADDYVPVSSRDFVFFEREIYDDRIRDFLDSHPDVIGIILDDFGTLFKPDRPNLHLMKKPETTMNMVRILNENFDGNRFDAEDKDFVSDFTAPDAKILVVDDNAINIRIAKELLMPLKIDIDSAEGGKEAVEKVSKNNYDIVLMDHMMPGTDGVDATRMIRENKDIVQPVIIALSANVLGEARTVFKDAGMNDFVAKPVDVHALTTVIKKWLPEEKIVEGDTSGGYEESSEGSAITGDMIIQCKHIPNVKKAAEALGSMNIYNVIAGEYYHGGEEKIKEIYTAYESEDWSDYTINVHSLKSSSRQIGADTLGDMAEKLEKAGEDKDIETIKAETESMMALYKEILAELKVYFGTDHDDNDEKKDKPLIDKDTFGSLLDELASACDELDMDGMEEAGSKLKGYSYEESQIPLMNELYKAIEDIDTEGCIEVIEKLRTVK